MLLNCCNILAHFALLTPVEVCRQAGPHEAGGYYNGRQHGDQADQAAVAPHLLRPQDLSQLPRGAHTAATWVIRCITVVDEANTCRGAGLNMWH